MLNCIASDRSRCACCISASLRMQLVDCVWEFHQQVKSLVMQVRVYFAGQLHVVPLAPVQQIFLIDPIRIAGEEGPA